MYYSVLSQLDALTDLYIFVASLAIGLLALLRWKSGPLRFWFAANCFLACIWSLSDAASDIGALSLFLFFLRLGSVGWIFLGPSLFIFLAYFLGREDLVQARRRRLLLLALAFPFWAAFVVSPGFFSSIFRSPHDGHYLTAPNSFFSFILVSVIGWAVVQVWILFRSLRRQFDPLIRRRSRVLMLLLAGMTALGVTTDVILPALNFSAFSLGGILYGLFCMTVFAMIQRFQLLPSAQVLSAKVDQLQEFNRTLEQKVEERTSELRASEQRYREIFENVQDFVFSLDLEARFTSANPQMERVTGVREKEVKGRSLFQVIGENCPPPLLEEWNRSWNDIQAQIRAPENLYRYEVLMPVPNGEVRNVIFTLSGIFREGKLAGYLGLGRDVTESQRAEEALRESETRHREIFENVQEIIISLDREGRIVSANPQIRLTLPVIADQISGQMLTDLIGAALPPVVQERWQRALRIVQAEVKQPQDKFEEVVLIPSASGEWRTYMFTFSGIFREGKLVGYLLLGRDVTESQRAEVALQKSEKRFRSLVENMNDWVWEVDRNGIYTYVSPIVKDLLGYEPEEVIGKTPFDFMPKDEAERMAGLFKGIIESSQPFAGLENTNLSQDGREVVLETSGVPVYDHQGNFSGYQGIDRDITERKMAEKALRESEVRYREIFDNVQEMIQSMDLEGRILSGNPRVRTLVGGNPEQNQGRLFSEVIADNLPPAVLEKWQKAWQQIRQGIQKPGDVFQEEVIVPIPSGEFKTLALTYSGIFRQGRLAGYLQMGRDITESVKLKRALEEYSANLEQLVAERTHELEATYKKLAESARLAGKAEMAAGVLHNMGNAINSIGVRLEMVRAHICNCPMESVLRAVEFLEQQQEHLGSFFREDPKGKQVLPFLKELAVTSQPVRAQMKETLEFVRGKIQHIAEIITVEQRYHRPGQLTEPADLNQVVREAFSLLQDSLQRRGIQIEQELAELPLLNLDRSQAIQVVFNLLKNAAEALEKNPEGERRLQVRSRAKDEGAGEVEISVEDNGIGIRPEDLPRLFQFGFTTKALRGGHGFGLHASANFIQSMGGRIEAASQGPGQGAVFRVYLPLGADQEKVTSDLEKEEDHEPAHIGD